MRTEIARVNTPGVKEKENINNFPDLPDVENLDAWKFQSRECVATTSAVPDKARIWVKECDLKTEKELQDVGPLPTLDQKLKVLLLSSSLSINCCVSSFVSFVEVRASTNVVGASSFGGAVLHRIDPPAAFCFPGKYCFTISAPLAGTAASAPMATCVWRGGS